MNSYSERLEKESVQREQGKRDFDQWLKQDKTYQEKMKAVVKYPTLLDGVPFAYAEDANPVQPGETVIVVDGYGETTVLTAVQVDSNLLVDGKRLKYTAASPEETPFEYFIAGELAFFDVKLSKNQVILVNGTLHTVKEINKETKQVQTEIKSAQKLRTLYPVYRNEWVNSEKQRTAELFYENWGEAFGQVLRKRFSGKQNYSL